MASTYIETKRKLKSLPKPILANLCKECGLLEDQTKAVVDFIYYGKAQDYLADSMNESTSTFYKHLRKHIERLGYFYDGNLDKFVPIAT